MRIGVQKFITEQLIKRVNQSLKSVDDAPFELFQNGAEFELREGSKLVATGKICTE